MGPLGLPLRSPNPGLRGRRESAHCQTTPTSPPEKPTTQNPKGKRMPNVSMGKHFTNGLLGLSMALNLEFPLSHP